MISRGRRLRPIVMISVMVPVSLGIVLLIVYLAGDFENLPAVMARTQWGWMLAVPCLLPLFYILHAFRIMLALKAAGAPVPRPLGLASCILSGNIVNAAVPGMGGELVAAFLAGRFHGVPMPSYLSASVFTKVAGLATNVSMALLGLALMPPEADGAEFSAARLLKLALGALLAAAMLVLLFPGLLKVAARLALRLFRIDPAAAAPAGVRRFVQRAAGGLVKTAEQFALLRRGGLKTAAKAAMVTVLINTAFAGSLVVGFIAVGYWPAFYQVLLFYSVMTIMVISAMIFLGSLGVAELTALLYWSHLTGLSASEIMVAFLAVKLWHILEMSSAAFMLSRYASRLTPGEVHALFRGEDATAAQAATEGAQPATCPVAPPSRR